jgi:hypothetical protein
MSPDGNLKPLILMEPPTISSFPLQRAHSMTNPDLDYDDDPYDMDSLVAQGRFVVHAKGMRDHSFHEV